MPISIFKNFQTKFSGSKTPCTTNSFNLKVVALNSLYHIVCPQGTFPIIMKFCKVYIGNISISIKIAAEIQFKVIYSTKFSQKWKSTKKCSKHKYSLHKLQWMKETELQYKSKREQFLSLTLKQYFELLNNRILKMDIGKTHHVNLVLFRWNFKWR